MDNLYEHADRIALENVEKDKQYDIFYRLAHEYEDLERVLKNEDLEIVPFTEEQKICIDKIHRATKKVFEKYNVVANPSLDTVFLYHINPISQDSESEGPYYILPETFIDPQTGLIYLDDAQLSTDGKIDLRKLTMAYAHELSHRYGVPNEAMTELKENEEKRKLTGFYLSTYFDNPNGTGYRSLEWINEVATVHLSKRIAFEAGLSEEFEPTSIDWNESISIEAEESFSILATNLGEYLTDEENAKDAQTFTMLVRPSTFDFGSFDQKNMKEFLIQANLDRNLHTGLIYLLYSAYSQQLSSELYYPTKWEKLLDDIGLFGIAAVEENTLSLHPQNKIGKKDIPYVAIKRQLAELGSKIFRRQELARTDLRFLYEIDPVTGFELKSYLSEMRKNRNPKKDLSIIFDCTEDKIALHQEDVKEDTIVLLGNYQPREDSSEIAKNLRYIVGDVEMRHTEIRTLSQLEMITGSVDLKHSKMEDLGKLHTIGGSLGISNTPLKTLGNLRFIGGDADFFSASLIDMGKLKHVGGTLNIVYTQVQNTGEIETIGRNADLFHSPLKEVPNLHTVGGRIVVDANCLADFSNVHAERIAKI